MSDTETSALAKSSLARAFGRFELRQLLGKSARTMTWLAHDPRTQQELLITMPRVQPAHADALDSWMVDARRAARLNHPNLAHVVETGVNEHWPFVAVDRELGLTLGERLAANPKPPPEEAVNLIVQLLEGLAFAHEAGSAHGDIQPHQVLVSDAGTVRVMAFGAGLPTSGAAAHSHDRAMPLDPSQLRAVRDAAVRDVLAAGLLLHQLLAGEPAFGDGDTAHVIERMSPDGREFVSLPWTTPHLVPEALRAIANRAVTAQERQRYHNARTMLDALRRWREAASQDTGGALALLIDRLRTVGHLPASASVGARVARLALAENQRTDEMAEQVLQDMGLSFELLRNVNSAQVQGTQIANSGPVLTIRRAIALLGLKGVRQAASSLRAWPGPLSEPQAAAMHTVFERVRLAGHVAQALRPAGYDPEVVYLVTTLQNLGRLMVQYHFPEEAEQIRQLRQSLPPKAPGEPELPGMAEQAAAYAVLGVDIESLGYAVARHWGLHGDVLHMIDRLPVDQPVRAPDTDADMLRVTASAANEVIDATQLSSNHVAAALAKVAKRYAHALSITAKDINESVQAGRQAMRGGSASVPRKPQRAEAEPGDPGTTGFAELMASRRSQSSTSS